MKKTSVVLIFALCFALLPVLGQAADDGAALFKQKCAACHGADGSGNTAMGKKNNIRPLGSADVQKQTDDVLTNAIANGGKDKKATHAFKSKGMTDAQIKALVAFIRTLKK